MKIINQLLSESPSSYDTMRFDIFFNWCQKYGRTPSRTQSLLANSNVNRWFNNEYHKLEFKFLEEVDPTQSVASIRGHYAEITSFILNYYPRPAITNSKKIKFDTQNYN